MSIARAYTRDMSEAELNWHDKHYQTLTPGQRAADHMRNGMGSWIFIGIFIGFMALWALINLTTRAWDPYPFILLNLFLSMLAGLQGGDLAYRGEATRRYLGGARATRLRDESRREEGDRRAHGDQQTADRDARGSP